MERLYVSGLWRLCLWSSSRVASWFYGQNYGGAWIVNAGIFFEVEEWRAGRLFRIFWNFVCLLALQKRVGGL